MPLSRGNSIKEGLRLDEDQAPDSEAVADRILLAEDDPVTRMLLLRHLKKSGYEVDAVADGTAALKKIAERYYPLIVTDWEMPGADGISICRAVRAAPMEGYVYVLLLTALDSKEHIIMGLEAGADDYLTKPVHEAELVARLKTGGRILRLEQSLRAASQENRWLSITDALTGSFNRRYLMEQLPREIERSRRYAHPVSVIMCDIDHFKAINDAHGHTVGDEVLRGFAERMRSCTRSTTDWIARYGGEEFLIVLPETPFAGGMQAAEKIRAHIAATKFQTPSGELRVTASFGVAVLSEDPEQLEAVGIDAMIQAADVCLYKSKQEGRDRVNGIELKKSTRLT